jgi:hypothetical protein
VNRQLDFVVEAADRMEGEIGELVVGPSSLACRSTDDEFVV